MTSEATSTFGQEDANRASAAPAGATAATSEGQPAGGTTQNSKSEDAPSQAHAPPQNQPPQQQPVNFNPRGELHNNMNPSRRVTIGGIQQPQQGGLPPPEMDRRGSMASINFNMDDFFTSRRPSMGMDPNMDSLFGRRGSMDSTALDAAILDLQRRRYSMVDANAGMDNSFSSRHNNTSNIAPPQPPPPPLQGSSAAAAAAGNLTARQQQLQHQQRELELRQKELEIQRQQLIASMQERNPSRYPPYSAAYNGSGSLGLGSVGSHGSSHGSGVAASASAAALYQSHRGSMGFSSMNSATNANQPPGPPHSGGSGGSGAQQWWICQLCNSKAFSSHEEAMAHERICSLNTSSHSGVTGPVHAGSSSMGGFGGPSLNLDYSQRSSMSVDSLHVGRNFSLGMDSSAGASYNNVEMSNGPFALMDKPQPLAMESDKDWLTPLHCFVRRRCVEVFTATQEDVATPSKGKRKPIHVGQVGIRCPHCHTRDSTKARERGSVYYPTTISSIYNATMNLLQRHLHNCTAVPDDIMRRYETLKADDARSGTSKKYWVESSLSLGLVDTSNGIRFSALQPPPLPSLTRPQESSGFHAARRNSNEFFSTHSNAMTEISENSKKGGEVSERSTSQVSTSSALVHSGDAPEGFINKTEQDMASSAPLVTADDQPYSTAFSYHLLSQMQPCLFTEADRLGKRKGLPPGFPGLACRHCFGGYGSGRFFPSSIKTLSDTSKTLNVLHNHMMRCRKCPAEVRESLEKLRGSHDDERAKMKFGSQKAFFARIWERLHGKGASPALKRKAPGLPVGGPPIMMDPYGGGGSLRGGPGNYMMSGSSRGSSHRLPPQSGMDALASAAGNPKRQKLH